MNHIIEKFLDEGMITKEAASRLELFEGSIKEASFMEGLKGLILETAKKVGPSALGTAVGVVGTNYLTKKHMEKQEHEWLETYQRSFDSIMSGGSFAGKENKALDRFSEVATFSPTVASIPSIAKPLVQRTLDSGLSEKDVRNLVQIEAGRRQGHSVSAPASAILFKSIVPGAVKSFGEGAVDVVDKGEYRLSPIDTAGNPALMLNLVRMLETSGVNLPEELRGLPSPENVESVPVEKLQRAVNFLKNNTAFIKDSIISNKLVDKANMMNKSASASSLNEMSMEKKAETLAYQYLMIKSAAPKPFSLMHTLMGLGAAALFGASGALIEEGVDYARSKKMNKDIEATWGDTKKKLKELNAKGSGFASGVDYSDKENIRKAEEAFKVLVDVAPSLATNASIAAPFVNTVVNQEGNVTPDVVKMLTETQKNINTTRSYRSPFADSPLASGFAKGFQGSGGREFTKELATGLALGGN